MFLKQTGEPEVQPALRATLTKSQGVSHQRIGTNQGDGFAAPQWNEGRSNHVGEWLVGCGAARERHARQVRSGILHAQADGSALARQVPPLPRRPPPCQRVKRTPQPATWRSAHHHLVPVRHLQWSQP